MGLDQHAFVVDADHKGKIYDGEEIAYWRKHNRLQGWMDALWHSKGNVTPDDVKAQWGTSFNGQPLEITLEDLKALEIAINARRLPKTGGFFFGHDSYEDGEGLHYEYLDKDMKFIADAMAEIAMGRKVYYVCSW